MSTQANNQLLSVMILQLLEEFNKLEEARGRGRGKGRGIGGDDTSTVTGGQQAGRGRGREGASTSTGGNKRPKTVGFGIYTDDISGRQTLNPGTVGERVVTPAVFKCATPTNIDIGYKPRGLKMERYGYCYLEVKKARKKLEKMSLKASPYPLRDAERNYNLAHEIKFQAEHSVPSPRRGEGFLN
uniref:Uncharacterized protein n=1 Tax=Solanum tuberosum TaxID=4113 RepID=M1BTJ5_SOLTU